MAGQIQKAEVEPDQATVTNLLIETLNLHNQIYETQDAWDNFRYLNASPSVVKVYDGDRLEMLLEMIRDARYMMEGITNSIRSRI